MSSIFKTVFIFMIFIFGACSASKKAEKSIESGNYDEAFNISYGILSKDKSDNEKIVKTFSDAYQKSNERDLAQIEMLKSQNNPLNLKKIYALYENIDIRQYQAITLKPLYYNNKEVIFEIKDYSTEIATSKKNYSQYILDKANEKMKGTKIDARDAYKLYGELAYINPTFITNISELVEKAKIKGSNFVYFNLDNKISTATPKEEIDELKRISESNMENPWMIYHSEKLKNTLYDYEINISLNKLMITPEKINSEVIPQQARISDGWEYVYDAKGNVLKDSLGNDIKRDRIITVQAEIRVLQQIKSSQIDGNVHIKNLKLNTTTVSSLVMGEAKFENVFGVFKGDQRAIEQKYYEILQNKEVPFPPDSEFIKYSLADFKSKMLQIINSQNL